MLKFVNWGCFYWFCMKGEYNFIFENLFVVFFLFFGMVNVVVGVILEGFVIGGVEKVVGVEFVFMNFGMLFNLEVMIF